MSRRNHGKYHFSALIRDAGLETGVKVNSCHAQELVLYMSGNSAEKGEILPKLGFQTSRIWPPNLVFMQQ